MSTRDAGTALSVVNVRDVAPAAGVAEILSLADELSRIGDAGTQLARAIESTTGLRAGEVQVLAAIAAGAEHPRAIADSTGQVPDAAEATVDSLADRGLVGRHAHESDPRGDLGLVHVSASGHAVLEQVEAVRIRLADALFGALGLEKAQELRRTLSAVAELVEAPALR
ncbi:MarR family winged helix-turn-helix transcriptional regulator [Ruania suaedae]|uniref:MarR family winged helix-turn-helix transcriptional regulator n=1 Tax=Ruania suaedae TaxID=2897774 RepID=UPI001E2FE59F|nr:MarR family winged helix-turn-helix transcriptional regulator [Ruania suaedae]UFU03676.1 MarR family winged helix-turn-helix transcriptional regulator [Ruania suaedae]